MVCLRMYTILDLITLTALPLYQALFWTIYINSLNLTATLLGWYYYFPPSKDEKTEAQRDEVTQGHTTKKWQSQD